MSNRFKIKSSPSTCDLANRQTQVISPQTLVTTMQYDALARVIHRQYANGAVTTQTYDSAGNIVQISNYGPTTLVSQLAYVYNKANQRVVQAEDDGTVTTWTYDNKYQLLNEDRSSGPAGTSFNLTHTYDPAGNRIALNNGATLTTYTYDNANRLTLANAGGAITTYTNDAAGNRTESNSASNIIYYTWDAVGRMATAEPTAGTVNFTYNTDGQRVVKQSTDGSVTGYLYDYKKLLAETDDVGGEINNLYATSTDQDFGDLISEDGDEMAHQYDAMANTNALLDISGNVEAKYKYYAFGQVASVAIEGNVWAYLTVDQWANMTVDEWAGLPVELSTNMLAGGKKQYYLDPETELYLLGTGTNGRYYDANTARFMSEDPIRQAAGDPNLYPYVENNPINRLDPSGHDDQSDKAQQQMEEDRKKVQEMSRRQSGMFSESSTTTENRDANGHQYSERTSADGRKIYYSNDPNAQLPKEQLPAEPQSTTPAPANKDEQQPDDDPSSADRTNAEKEIADKYNGGDQDTSNPTQPKQNEAPAKDDKTQPQQPNQPAQQPNQPAQPPQQQNQAPPKVNPPVKKPATPPNQTPAPGNNNERPTNSDRDLLQRRDHDQFEQQDKAKQKEQGLDPATIANYIKTLQRNQARLNELLNDPNAANYPGNQGEIARLQQEDRYIEHILSQQNDAHMVLAAAMNAANQAAESSPGLGDAGKAEMLRGDMEWDNPRIWSNWNRNFIQDGPQFRALPASGKDWVPDSVKYVGHKSALFGQALVNKAVGLVNLVWGSLQGMASEGMDDPTHPLQIPMKAVDFTCDPFNDPSPEYHEESVRQAGFPIDIALGAVPVEGPEMKIVSELQKLNEVAGTVQKVEEATKVGVAVKLGVNEGLEGASTADKGALAEQAAAKTLTRAGYTELPARLARNNGFDGVWIKQAADGSIQDIIVSESKFSATGKAALTETETMGKQLSDEWINANIRKMLASTDPEVQATGRLLNSNRALIRTKANVLTPDMINRWNAAK